MVEIPDNLRTLFSARLDEDRGQYVFEVPAREVSNGTLEAGDTYQVAVLETDSSQPETAVGHRQETARQLPSSREDSSGDPPVEEGEQRTVEIDELGEEGDGVATVDGGFVVFVEGAMPGETPTIEIERVADRMAFATVVDDHSQTPTSP